MEPSSEALDTDRIEMILSAKFEYYKKLSSEDKQKFIERTYTFQQNKEFLPRDESGITDSMDDIKTLISAAAIQVTFGLAEFELPHFTKVFIYPREYYNRMTHHWHKGEANVIGALVFSWKAFKEGYADEHDKINLGLHEMAHALMLTINIDEGRDDFFVSYFDKWWAVSNAEFQKLEKHETSFFRDYGGTNPQEFFAVCVECFFEAANEFKEKHPEIYRQTCILLNQDPSADFSRITGAREPLLMNIANATPGNLVYRTKGRNLLNALVPSIGFGGYAFFALVLASNVAVTQNIIVLGSLALIIVFLLIRFIKYKEFYVYDNAFAIGYERHGEDLEKQDVVAAPLCVSIAFTVIHHIKGGDDNVLQLTYIKEGELTKADWKYNHIKSEQVSTLKNAVKEYCIRNHIGFHNVQA